MKLVNKWRPV